MGYFGKQVGKPVGPAKDGAKEVAKVPTQRPTQPAPPTLAGNRGNAHFAAQVGKQAVVPSAAALDRCPRCNGVLADDDGYVRCGGRCGRRWIAGGPGRWLDPATLPYGACNCCRPRMALVAAEVGAICPHSHTDYLILPEGVTARAAAAPLGICRCCLPPQPLIKTASGLVCRNKPQQHYGEVNGEIVWLGLTPVVDQATVTAAIDAALSANNAELTLFGLFAPPTER